MSVWEGLNQMSAKRRQAEGILGLTLVVQGISWLSGWEESRFTITKRVLDNQESKYLSEDFSQAEQRKFLSLQVVSA